MFHGGGLPGTGEDGGFCSAGKEIGGEFLDPLELFRVGDRGRAFRSDAEFAADLRGEGGDHAWRDTQAVISHSPGKRESGLHGVEAVHRGRIGLGFVALSFGLPAVEKRDVRSLRIRACEITVEREDAVGFLEIRHELHALAKDRAVVGGKRLVLVKLRVLVFSEFRDQAEAGRAFVGSENETDFRGLVLRESGENSFELRAFRSLPGLEEFP